MTARLVLLLVGPILFFSQAEATKHIYIEQREGQAGQLPPAPNYARLQTSVLLKQGEPVNALGCSGNRGLEVMVKTYEVAPLPNNEEEHRVAWAATVQFAPLEKASDIEEQESQVILSYTYHPEYFSNPRAYGRTQQTADTEPMVVNNPPFKLRMQPSIRNHQDPNDPCPLKKWLQTSLFEWTLPQPLTIRDLHSDVNYLKITGTHRRAGSFPNYHKWGYSADGGALNCATFSAVLLRRLGVDVSVSPEIQSYIGDYMARTSWGSFTAVVEDTLLIGGAIGAAGGGAYGGAVAAAPWGAVGGPIGIGVAAVVGGVAGGVTGFFGGAFIGGTTGNAAKNSLNKASHIKNLIRPEYVCRKLYDVRNDLGRPTSMVRTRTNGGPGGQNFDSIPLRNMVQNYQDNLPAGSYASYHIHY